MRSHLSHLSGQRSLDSRTAQQSACSCSYPIQPVNSLRHERQVRNLGAWKEVVGRRPSSACGAWSRGAVSNPVLHEGARNCRKKGVSSRCFAAADPGPGPDSVISGYTPANYISFSENEKDVAPHTFVIEVDAPPSICFGIWNDWNRLVEFLDLVAQIGLDANNPDLALFQCFYRHGLLPVMEIVFVLQKTEVIPDKRIAFESVWGMPLSGSVSFKALQNGKSRVKLSFSQALPDLLVDLKVGVFGVQNSLMPIFSENLNVFRSIAETEAHDSSSLPPRAEAGERAYALFDEEADIAMFEEIMENLELNEDEEEKEEEDELARSAAALSTGPSTALLDESARTRDRGEGRDPPGHSHTSASRGVGQAVMTAAAGGPMIGPSSSGAASRVVAGGFGASSSRDSDWEEPRAPSSPLGTVGTRRATLATKMTVREAATASLAGEGSGRTRKRAVQSRGAT